MTQSPFISVIIPTYNRKDSLLRTLESLARQTYPADRFEVIVVDDGGSDGTGEVTQRTFPFALRYVRQENQGDAIARNRGASEAQGDVLQFLDDDIVVEPGFLEAIVQQHSHGHRLMVVGRLLLMPSAIPTTFEQVVRSEDKIRRELSGELHFTAVLSGVLSIRKADYLALGMMQPLAISGSSVWCDVDLAYRAHLQGFAFRRCDRAIAYHNDSVARDLRSACRRAERSARAGVALFQRFPDLQPHIPMFRDKGPIAWRQDPPRLILRKLARHVASSRPAMWSMERLVHILEQRHPSPALLRPLYRWIIGGYIFRGYREGLRENQGRTRNAVSERVNDVSVR